MSVLIRGHSVHLSDIYRARHFVTQNVHDLRLRHIHRHVATTNCEVGEEGEK